MTAPGIRVSREWLALREPADSAARARDLVERLVRELRTANRRVIHDLGCGTGAMGRWLAPLLPGPQHWVVHDRDEDLLALAAAERPGPAADGAAVTVEAKRSDITRLNVDDLAEATLITASALLDMLTEDELGGLVSALCPRRIPGAAHSVRRRSRRLDPGGSTRRARGRCVQRTPTPRDRARPPARPGCRRARRRGVPPTGRRGPRPAQPLATRRLAGRPGGGLVHRVGACRVRAAGRAGRRDRALQTATSGAGNGRTARRHRGPRRPARSAVAKSVGLKPGRERVAQQHHIADLADVGEHRAPTGVPGETAIAQPSIDIPQLNRM